MLPLEILSIIIKSLMQQSFYQCAKKSYATFSPGTKIIDYYALYGNQVVVFNDHIMFNSHRKDNYSNSETYAAILAADHQHVVIFCRNPDCIQILNLEGGFWVMRQK